MADRGDRRLSLRMPSSAQSPSIARRAVGALVDDHPIAARRRDMLILLISEIVTNAVIHPEVPPEAEIELSVVVDEELSRVLVSDEGRGFDQPPGRGGPEGGYGLMLLDSGASRWGTVKAARRFTVWFEVDLACSEEDRTGDGRGSVGRG